MRRVALAVIIASVGLVGIGRAQAQHFGQWSWDAELGLAFRLHRNALGGARTTSYGQRELRASFGVNGFVAHPAIASFRVAGDGLLSWYNGGGSRTSRLGGLRGDLRVLPTGPCPLWLYASRHRFDLGEEESRTGFGAATPDGATRYGGHLRVRRGWLRGLLAGADRTSYQFLQPGLGEQREDRDYVDWSRSSAQLTHHYRVEHQIREYGFVDETSDDTTVTVDEHGMISRSWRWDLSGTSIKRDLRSGSARYEFDTRSLHNDLLYTSRGGATVDLGYAAGINRGARESRSQALSVSVRKRLTRGWTLSEDVIYGQQEFMDISSRSVQGGVSGGWGGNLRAFDVTLTGNARYGTIRSDDEEARPDSRFLARGLGASIAHGKETSLRKELEVSWSRSSLRSSGEARPELPGLGTELAGLGTENLSGWRFSLHRRWEGARMRSYVDWNRRESDLTIAGGRSAMTTLTTSVNVDSARRGVFLNAGRTEVEQKGGVQNVASASAGAWMRAGQFVNVRGSYSRNVRDAAIGPDIRSDRIEVRADAILGPNTLEARVFRTAERTASSTRVDTGAQFSIGRRFGGWLPFVSAPARRGVIR